MISTVIITITGSRKTIKTTIIVTIAIQTMEIVMETLDRATINIQMPIEILPIIKIVIQVMEEVMIAIQQLKEFKDLNKVMTGKYFLTLALKFNSH